MKAGAHTLNFLTRTGRFEIPFFQRSYVWDKDNWDAMLLDFTTTKSQFLGSVILKHLIKDSDSDVSRALVIDGQQRLTTLSILIKALNDSLFGEGQVNPFAYLYLFYKPSASKNKNVDYPRIFHSRLDKDDFEFVLRSGPDKIINSNRDSKIVNCYRHYAKELASITKAAREELFDRLVSTEDDNPFLVVIDLHQNDDNEQAIFDTINSAGVRLSCADTIKNLLFKVAMEKAASAHGERVYELYDDCWAAEFEDDVERRDYWLREAQSVRVKRTMLEMFLHSYAIMKKFYDPRVNNLGELPKLYERMVSEKNLDEIIAFIRELVTVAGLCREQFGSFGMNRNFSYKDSVGRLFHILEQCNVLTFHPYILYLFYTYQDDHSALETRFRELERFVIRQNVAHWTTRQNNKYCVEFIENPDLVKQCGDEIPECEIEAGLRHIGNHQAKLVLFWIELHRRYHDANVEMRELPYGYQLEHVLPQKWENTWSDVPYVTEDGLAISDPEIGKKERCAKCFEIGNMTLLSGGLNREISNSSFAIKVKGDHLPGKKPRKGMKDYAELLVTKTDIVNPYDDGEVVWNEARIAKRTKQLIDEFKQLWK